MPLCNCITRASASPANLRLPIQCSTKRQLQQVFCCYCLVVHDPLFASAQAQSHVATVSATTLSLPLAGDRVAETRDAAKAAAEVAAAAVASVMQAKAELHRCTPTTTSSRLVLHGSPPQSSRCCQCCRKGRSRRSQRNATTISMLPQRVSHLAHSCGSRPILLQK